MSYENPRQVEFFWQSCWHSIGELLIFIEVFVREYIVSSCKQYSEKRKQPVCECWIIVTDFEIWIFKRFHDMDHSDIFHDCGILFWKLTDVMLPLWNIGDDLMQIFLCQIISKIHLPLSFKSWRMFIFFVISLFLTLYLSSFLNATFRASMNGLQKLRNCWAGVGNPVVRRNHAFATVFAPGNVSLKKCLNVFYQTKVTSILLIMKDYKCLNCSK